MRQEIYKDGKGNVVISEQLFSLITGNIDNIQLRNYCIAILHQQILIEPKSDNYYLTKRYSHQRELISWYDGNGLCKVLELFKDTELKRPELTEEQKQLTFKEEKFYLELMPVMPEKEPFKIETAFRSEGEYLTISEDGVNNRPWTQEEINAIQNIINK